MALADSSIATVSLGAGRTLQSSRYSRSTRSQKGNAQEMNICVVGAGAIGGLLAYRLAAASERVSVVARGAHLHAIRSGGLTLVDAMAGRTLDALPIAASAEPADHGAQDVVVIALKAHAIPAMLPRLQPLLKTDTVVVPAINGLPWWYFFRQPPFENWALKSLDPQGTMFRDLDTARVIGCVVHAAAEVTAPGVVTHTGGWRFVVGEPGTVEATARLQGLVDTLVRAGFEAPVSRNIRYDVWFKLIGNLSFNPIAALHGKRMNEICASEELCAVIRPMMAEAMQVAERLGIRIDSTPDQRIDVARKLGNAKISMHQDFEAGRKLELDAIVKSVIEVADRLGVPVPAIRDVDTRITALATERGLYP